MNAVPNPRKMVMPCLQCGTHMAVGVKADSAGRNMYKWFCQSCNWRMGQWLSHALVDELLANNQYVAIPLPEKSYEETQWELREKEREAERAEAREAYYRYLQSDEWKRKRALVLERDNHTCQACLSAPATQVHHTSYQGVDALLKQFQEPLFNLQSVCRSCHILIHGGNLSDDEAT